MNVHVCRGQDTHIRVDHVAAAEPGILVGRKTCRSFACRCGLISAISSRKIVPLFASSNFPGFERTAPVNAPWSYPNNSDSSNSPGSAAQFTLINGNCRLIERR